MSARLSRTASGGRGGNDNNNNTKTFEVHVATLWWMPNGMDLESILAEEEGGGRPLTTVPLPPILQVSRTCAQFLFLF